MMASYIIPVFILILCVFCLIKNINAYSCFANGASEAVNLAIKTFPLLVAIFCAIELFKISGLSSTISSVLAPVFSFLGIPRELTDFLVLRPFSGTGSLAMISEIYQTYGPDSYIARSASVIMSCTETVFYIVAIYFTGTKVKKLGYTIPVALLSCFIGSIIACLLCRVI
ncbi:MAG: spore maturation protein [Clostridia bacterium]|nr:spore maturation protein [Clostridia bacterium]